MENIEEKKALRVFIIRKISSIREAKGFSARNLSLELNRSSEYINQVENARLQPTLDFLLDFCTFFGITLSEFFDNENSHPLQCNEICKNLSYLSSEEVSNISALLKSIADSRR